MDKSRYTNPALRKKLFDKIKKGTKGGNANEWSARKAQLLVKEYESKGGGYNKRIGKEQKKLKDWQKQDWQTSETFDSKKRGDSKEVKSMGKKRYLPKKAWEELTLSEKKKTNKAKLEAYKRGEQYSKQPKSIAKKTSKHRK